MTTLTDWLDQAQARVDAATPGPWSTTHGPTEHPRVWGPDDDDAEPIALVLGFLEPDDAKATAELVAHARTDLPAVLTALRAVLTLADQIEAEAPKPMVGGFLAEQLRDTVAEALGVEP